MYERMGREGDSVTLQGTALHAMGFGGNFTKYREY